MLNRQTQICGNYAEAVFERAIKPFEPPGFAPNWKDQPSRFKIYSSVERIPLPLEPPARLASLKDVLERMAAPQAEKGSLTLPELATMLLFTHGLLNRRIAVSWNRDDRVLDMYDQAVYGRGAASGGGLYPTEVYWSCGSDGPLPAGIYHYDNAHHAMEYLFRGNVTHRIQQAVFHHPAAEKTNQFLLLAPNFWKNAFKYNTFCYHVVTQDLGVLLCSLRMAAAGFGSDLQFLSWFQDEELNKLLGFETLSDSVFAVLPLCMAQSEPTRATMRANTQPLKGQLFSKTSFQRSKTLVRFPLIEEIHMGTLIDEEPRPDKLVSFEASNNLYEADGERIELPPPALDRLQGDVLQLFQQRRSSFGAFSNHILLSPEELATLLYCGSAACNYVSDIRQTGDMSHFTSLMVFIMNVEGIERGAYAYDRQRHCLWRVQTGDFSVFLQNHYFLRNYSLEEVGAMIAIVGSVEEMLAVYGNRGYRMLNAEVGMIAQSVYMTATAMSFGCGATLGFDNSGLNGALGLEGSNRKSLLFLLAGHEREGSASFDCRFV